MNKDKMCIQHHYIVSTMHKHQANVFLLLQWIVIIEYREVLMQLQNLEF